MSLLQKFQDFIKDNLLFRPTEKLILAVSGGVDSVVLCELFNEAGFKFMIAHCNFQLRGEESERDAEFIKQLGATYKAEVAIRRFDTEAYAKEHKRSIQVAARELRYDWLNEIINSEGRVQDGEWIFSSKPDEATGRHALEKPRWICTAHHADDNIETMLMNFFKGTGMAGLRAMLPKQGKVVRPLLFARKQEIMDFAKQHSLQYVEDSSNASSKYTRNYFRNELIPGVQKVYPAVEENLLNNVQRFMEAEQLYQQSINEHRKKLLEFKGNEVHIPVLKLKKTVPLETVLFEVTREYGFTPHQVKDIINLLDSETGKFVQSASHRVIRNRNWLIIAPKKAENAQTIIVENATATLRFEAGTLQLRLEAPGNGQELNSPDIARLDAEEIRFPLLLRKWKRGDYFYPLGMRKKKKLNRFFTDKKLSVTEKENIWVLEMDKKICWVIGQRIDDRFRITPRTSQALHLTFNGNG